VQSRLPADVTLRDLGWHRLKDIEAPEHIYQLAAAGLPDQFPPLRSLGAQTSLPVPLTPLVGRDNNLSRLRTEIQQPGVRLVTLTGTGGVGKTRLALAAASSLGDAFPHGVYFVPLAAVRDAEVMWKAIADDLDAGADRPAAEAATEYLSKRQAMLVLDNLEQLDGASKVVAALIAAAPGLVVLATSRRPLHLQGEHEQPVPPLGVPRDADLAGAATSGAAQPFVQQADMVVPGFVLTDGNAADVGAICRRLDGLPLAIELAASRVKLLGPRALLARLGHSLGLAAGDVGRPSRHQTLRNTIAWSYDLLAPDLAGVFRRAGVFAAGCDLDALAAVAMADHGPGTEADPLQQVAGLLDVSLITVTEGADGEPRVGMLETIREYALELLERSGELDDSRRRHANYYAAFAERAHGQLRGPAHLTALDGLEAEHDNLRAALAWSLEARAPGPARDSERAAVGLRLVQALGPFWYQHGHATEGRQWLERAVELASDDAGEPLARVAHWLGVLLAQQSESGAALPFLQRSLAIWRDLGNEDQVARELNSLGIIHRYLGDLDTARSLLEDSVAMARKHGGSRLPTALTNLGQVESAAGNLSRATEVLREALALDRARGDTLGAAIDVQSLATASLRAGRVREARHLLSPILDYVASCGDTEFLATTMELYAAATADLGNGLPAARLAGAAEGIRERARMPIPDLDAALLEWFLAPARAVIARDAWDTELAAGRALAEEQAITLLVSPASAHDAPG
jgi:predicted ATPase